MVWTRRKFLTTSSLAVVGAARAVPLWGQAKPLVGTFTELRNNVGTFLCRGGTTTWAITPEAVIMVDSQMMDSAPVFLEGLKARTTHAGVDAVVNTHYHGDHTGGNAVLRPVAKLIIAHERLPGLQRKLAEAPDAPPQVYADTTYPERWRRTFGKVTLSLVHHGPGHTSGDTVAYFEEANVAAMGDLMYNRRHPNVDRAAGGSVRNWIAWLEKTTAEFSPDTLYVTGHNGGEDLGFVVTKADVLHFRDYFSAVLDYVQKGIAAGHSKDELAKRESLPRFEDIRAQGRFTLGNTIGIVFDELSA
jgi:glyoxylase-like metal-dependent hydrolase (beta-lactamase superfamily II)